VRITIKGHSLTLREWHSILIDWIEWRILMPARLMRCQYCGNGKDTCDCGACGIDAGGLGYLWCMSFNGCPVCRRGK
jgi:hypothetical protein